MQVISAPVESKPAKIHARTWMGSGCARVTDMANAGKRGKTCRTIRVSGVSWDHWVGKGDPVKEAAIQYTREMMYFVENLPDSSEFDAVRSNLLRIVDLARVAGVAEGLVAIYDEEIKGISAPRPVLSAGVEGVWSASADEGGIRMHALNDVNEWSEITHGQTNARAYEIARKVWVQVSEAKTLHEASTVLRNAGAKLHGYCGMD